ncbi:rhomboid family intramembrane serine protease [Edaphobacter flagellatus]|uniref:rhomboid family intramembrane serine protease n=1 Tax=Edaphobacter flagellatus TaxID=1933044 RepID=UPI0021B19A61|nr:rhomboid family intramembrane serine protease [Edaphobacter flagellatus]
MSSSPQPEGEILPPSMETDRRQETFTPPPSRQTRSILSAPGTYALVGINSAVFIWMVLHGVSPASPTPAELIHFGGNVPVLVLHGQWYRLLTATFVHVGLIHLLTNMWCLWNLGLLGEPLLGPWGMVAVYMLTGIAGNLLSLGVNVVLHDFVSVGAGASGAVFGIAGILIVLLSNHKLPIPVFELQRLRKSVIQFAGLNLIIGLATIALPLIRIDNSAHVGGFLFGLALGVPLVPRMTSGRARYLQRQKITFAGAAFFLALFGYWIANLR